MKKNKQETLSAIRLVITTIGIVTLAFKLIQEGDVSKYELLLIENKNEFVKNKLFEEQLRYREEIISSFEKNYKKLDSIKNLSPKLKFKLTSLEEKEKIDTIFVKDIETLPSYFLNKLQFIKYKYSLKKDKILSNFNPTFNLEDFKDKLKYYDYIKIEGELHKVFNTNLIIYFLIWFVIIIITYIPQYIYKNTNKKYIVTNQDKDELKDSINTIKSDETSNNEKFLNRINELESQTKKLLEKDKLENLINLNIKNIENLVFETKNRANFMLVSGILIAILAILFFYLNLSEINYNDGKNSYLKLIRPITILIFIESISWFLLKQYRKIISDYKFFYNIYQEKMKILELYKVSKEHENLDISLFYNYLSEQNNKMNLDQKETDISNDNNSDKLFKLIYQLISKINPK
ncbi:hypothetical protein [Aureivirga marina]|uniref:hypothetical protein n=1 Tax=Aureivirga marina TaxID=1182451 RepID=UPI0018CB19D7|nr:hypothetical protein [Aureivirga marina]